MSFRLNGKTITMTRGDTVRIGISLTDDEGAPYIPEEGDSIRFACKKTYDGDLLIEKDIPTDTLILKLEPEDTKPLPFGKYVYDMQITFANGDVCTFVDKGQLKLTEEVD